MIVTDFHLLESFPPRIFSVRFFESKPIPNSDANDTHPTFSVPEPSSSDEEFDEDSDIMYESEEESRSSAVETEHNQKSAETNPRKCQSVAVICQTPQVCMFSKSGYMLTLNAVTSNHVDYTVSTNLNQARCESVEDEEVGDQAVTGCVESCAHNKDFLPATHNHQSSNIEYGISDKPSQDAYLSQVDCQGFRIQSDEPDAEYDIASNSSYDSHGSTSSDDEPLIDDPLNGDVSLHVSPTSAPNGTLINGNGAIQDTGDFQAFTTEDTSNVRTITPHPSSTGMPESRVDAESVILSPTAPTAKAPIRLTNVMNSIEQEAMSIGRIMDPVAETAQEIQQQIRSDQNRHFGVPVHSLLNVHGNNSDTLVSAQCSAGASSWGLSQELENKHSPPPHIPISSKSNTVDDLMTHPWSRNISNYFDPEGLQEPECFPSPYRYRQFTPSYNSSITHNAWRYTFSDISNIPETEANPNPWAPTLCPESSHEEKIQKPQVAKTRVSIPDLIDKSEESSDVIGSSSKKRKASEIADQDDEDSHAKPEEKPTTTQGSLTDGNQAEIPSVPKEELTISENEIRPRKKARHFGATFLGALAGGVAMLTALAYLPEQLLS
jgi:hypothetical protein